MLLNCSNSVREIRPLSGEGAGTMGKRYPSDRSIRFVKPGLLIFLWLMGFAGLGQPVDEQSVCGIGVFDTLYVGGNSSLHVQGDVYLRDAHVLGSGTFVLDDDASQRIIAHYSEVSNLKIANPTQVVLTGDLQVTQTLTVEAGVFRADQADLILTDSTKLRFLLGGKLHGQAIIVASSSSRNTVPQFAPYSLDAVLVDLYLLEGGRFYEQKNYYELDFIPELWPSLGLDSPPPERV